MKSFLFYAISQHQQASVPLSPLSDTLSNSTLAQFAKTFNNAQDILSLLNSPATVLLVGSATDKTSTLTTVFTHMLSTETPVYVLACEGRRNNFHMDALDGRAPDRLDSGSRTGPLKKLRFTETLARTLLHKVSVAQPRTFFAFNFHLASHTCSVVDIHLSPRPVALLRSRDPLDLLDPNLRAALPAPCTQNMCCVVHMGPGARENELLLARLSLLRALTLPSRPQTLEAPRYARATAAFASARVAKPSRERRQPVRPGRAPIARPRATAVPISASKETLTLLRAQCKQQQERIAALEAASKTVATDLQSKIAEQTAYREEVELRTRTLERDLAEAQEEAARQAAAFGELRTDLVQVKTELDAKSAALEESNLQLAKSADALEVLQQTENSVQTALRDAQQKLDLKVEALAAAMSELGEVQKNLAEAQDELAAVKTEMLKKVAAAQDELAAAQNELVLLRQEIADKDHTIRNMEDTHQRQQTALEEQLAKMEELTQQQQAEINLLKESDTTAVLQQQLAEKAHIINGLEETLTASQQRLEDSLEDAKQITIARDNLQSQVDTLKAEKESLMAEKEALSHQVTNTDTMVVTQTSIAPASTHSLRRSPHKPMRPVGGIEDQLRSYSNGFRNVLPDFGDEIEDYSSNFISSDGLLHFSPVDQTEVMLHFKLPAMRTLSPKRVLQELNVRTPVRVGKGAMAAPERAGEKPVV